MMVCPTENDLMKVMEKQPWLCAWGYANRFSFKYYKPSKTDLKQERESLKRQVRGFQLACKFLSLCKIQKKINTRIGSSYSLQRGPVKKWAGGEYIGNGGFAAAVIHLGIPFRSYDDSPNIHIAISSRSPLLRCAVIGA